MKKLNNSGIILQLVAHLMLSKIVVSLIVSCLVSVSHAQVKLSEFGKPDLSELQMKEYAPDKNADAVKLLDYQETELIVDYGLIRMETERRVRIKIFNENGFDQGSITIPYINRKKTKFKDIRGYVYYLDSAGMVITHKIDKDEILYNKSEDGLSKLAFAFPNLRSGCVVEYRYTKTEKNYIHLDPWIFQDEIPTQLSFCKIIYPSHLDINLRAISPNEIIEDRKSKYEAGRSSITRVFTLENLPAFKIEPVMSSVKDNLQRLEFNISPHFSGNYRFLGLNKWQIYTRILYAAPFFGKQFDLKIPGTEAILDSVKKLQTHSQKIDYIYRETKKKIKWDEEQTFFAEDLDKVWQKGIGNSAEINLTILNLLKKSGVKAYPLLVSTRENGRPDENFISLGQFNGIDVLTIDSTENFILDGTQKYQSYKIPPFNILNRSAFLVDTATGKWVNIEDPRPLVRNTVVIYAKFEEDGMVTGESNITYYDLSKSQKLTEKPEEDDEKDFIQKEFTDMKIDSLKEIDKEDDLKPLIHQFQFQYSLTNNGNFYFLDPFFLSSFRKNPFIDSLRNTDIDFGSNFEFNLTLHLEVPKNFDVDRLPKNTFLRTADSAIMFRVSYEIINKMVIFKNLFQLQRPLYDKEDYPAIKEIFGRIYGIINERIVIKKP